MKGMRGVWTAKNHFTVDGSIINYMGRAVIYVQYIPENLIKHVIKESAICCDLSAILLGFKVYVVQEDDPDNAFLGFFDDMVKESGIISVRGRTLYTNNYYTSMALAKNMLNKYGWTIVGTILPTDNNSRADHNITFLKLSNVSKNGLKQA